MRERARDSTGEGGPETAVRDRGREMARARAGERRGVRGSGPETARDGG